MQRQVARADWAGCERCRPALSRWTYEAAWTDRCGVMHRVSRAWPRACPSLSLLCAPQPRSRSRERTPASKSVITLHAPSSAYVSLVASFTNAISCIRLLFFQFRALTCPTTEHFVASTYPCPTRQNNASSPHRRRLLYPSRGRLLRVPFRVLLYTPSISAFDSPRSSFSLKTALVRDNNIMSWLFMVVNIPHPLLQYVPTVYIHPRPAHYLSPSPQSSPLPNPIHRCQKHLTPPPPLPFSVPVLPTLLAAVPTPELAFHSQPHYFSRKFIYAYCQPQQTCSLAACNTL